MDGDIKPVMLTITGSPVIDVKQNPKKPEQAYIKLQDGTDAWCPDWEAAKTLKKGEPLPEDWTQDQGDYGPRIFPPKKPGQGTGKAAYRNTKDGMREEQASIHRSVAFQQERSDRRTALMQAVAANMDLAAADVFYEWLRKTSPASGPSGLEGPVEGSAGGTSPWSGDSDPSGNGEERGPGGPLGEGGTPGLAPTFDELVALAGSASKAREAINDASAAEYTPKSVREATDLERTAARELLLGL